MDAVKNPTAFPKLEEAQIQSLAKWSKLKSFKAGETLFSAGEPRFNFYIVKTGEVAITVRTGDQDQLIVVHEFREFTGDVDMLTGRPAIVTGIAKTDCEVYEISAEDLRRVLSEMPRLSDTLLRAFIMRREMLEATGYAAVRVVGSRYSKDTHRIREFLAKNKVPFSWIDLENDSRVDALLEQFKITVEETPVVICTSNNVLNRNPSNVQLADCLGIRRPLDHAVFDLAVIGAGPAGLAAAVYGASEGLKTVLLDKIGPGGQAGTSSKIENYMGFPTGLSGADLAERALIQAEKFGATLSTPADVVELKCDKGYHVLRLSTGEEISTKCVLISAGIAYRKLPLEGCERFEGSGIYYAATVVEAEMCRNQPVTVVGSGNSAGQAAVFLSDRSPQVELLIHGTDLGKNMSQYLVKRIEQTSNIRLRRDTEIVKIHGDASMQAIDLFCKTDQSKETVDCRSIFVFIGSTPHTNWLPKALHVDPSGFIKTGTQILEDGKWKLARQPFLLETNLPGVFAAGDVRCGSTKRIASAVGEGSMAVQFVHEYLAHS